MIVRRLLDDKETARNHAVLSETPEQTGGGEAATGYFCQAAPPRPRCLVPTRAGLLICDNPTDARSTPMGRERLVVMIAGGMTFSQAIAISGCSAKTATK